MTFTAHQQTVIDQMQERQKRSRKAEYFMMITDSSDGPVMIIRERYVGDQGAYVIRDLGKIYGKALKFCKPAIRYMMTGIFDDLGNDTQVSCLIDDRMAYRGEIDLDRESGNKLALLATLASNRMDDIRLELLAWRISRYTAEEAMYWLGKCTIPTFGEESRQWAIRGMREMLCGTGQDRDYAESILVRLRR